MSTFKEENAITYRLAKMQKKWIQFICKKAKVIRWLVDKDEARMVKAFAVTEASEHGKIEDLFINFETPFIDPKLYGKTLANDFVTLWNSKEAREEVAHANVLPQWDDTPYQEIQEKDSHLSFLQCMSSFADAIDDKTNIVLFLSPSELNNGATFANWVLDAAESLPSNLKIMVCDLKEKPHFKNFEESKTHITLEADLDMRGAIRELITAGDTNNPAIGVNLCILNLTEASGKKDIKAIHHWGKEGIRLAKETGFASIHATVLLAYGSAFYQLKKFDLALDLYHKAEIISLEGLSTEDTVSATLLIQAYHFQAATYLYTKKKEKAFDYYQKTATEAFSQKNTLLYLEASRQAAYIAKKRYEDEQAYTILKDTYSEGKKLAPHTSKFSSMLLICVGLHAYADDFGNDILKNEVSSYATTIWGEHWQDLSEKEAYETILTA